MHCWQAATVVLCNLFVRSFEKIDDVKMEFSLQITFRQTWYDNRLEFDNMGGKIKYLTMTDRGKVWMPDTFFRNEKAGNFHTIIQPNLYVRLFPNGDVLYSIRVSIGSLSCDDCDCRCTEICSIQMQLKTHSGRESIAVQVPGGDDCERLTFLPFKLNRPFAANQSIQMTYKAWMVFDIQ